MHDGAPGNVAFKWELGDAAATEAAIKGAAVTVKKRIVNQRLVANAMEPRACVARYDDATGELTLWVTSQNPHVHRLLMCAFVLGIPEHKVRVIAPDVGGGFGSKIFLYNEEVVCSWASRLLKRPVRWTSTRHEAYLTDAHGRDHVTDAEMAHVGRRQDPRRCGSRPPRTWARICRRSRRRCRRSSTARCSTACTRSGRSTSRSPASSPTPPRSTPIAAPGGRKPPTCWSGWWKRPRPRSRWTCSRCAGRTSSRSSRARTRRTWPCRTTAATTQARSTS